MVLTKEQHREYYKNYFRKNIEQANKNKARMKLRYWKNKIRDSLKIPLNELENLTVEELQKMLGDNNGE